MQISVIICTWNRCNLLRSTLESLCSVIVPSNQGWEVVVVDNNSSDETEQVVLSFDKRLPIRYALETKLGISKARNTGVGAARGELLLFADDDVIIDTHWMQAYIEATQRYPDALYFGGVISPAFSAAVPAWVEHNRSCLGGMLCCLDIGSDTRRFASDEYPYGPNMALRREAFALAKFNEYVGRKGGEQIRGCETSVFLALERLGAIGAWVPGARVHHRISAQQTSTKYLWNYYYGHGRTAVRLGRGYREQSRRHLMEVALKTVLRSCLRPHKWPIYLSHMARMSGQYYETRQLSLQSSNVEELPA